MPTIEETCTNTDCDEAGQLHTFPVEGTPVRVIDTVETREPGDDDCKPILVHAGETGVAIDYVVEWHDVVVILYTQDGQEVWISWDNLEVIEAEPPPSEIFLNPALGPNPMDKEKS